MTASIYGLRLRISSGVFTTSLHAAKQKLSQMRRTATNLGMPTTRLASNYGRE